MGFFEFAVIALLFGIWLRSGADSARSDMTIALLRSIEGQLSRIERSLEEINASTSSTSDYAMDIYGTIAHNDLDPNEPP